MIFMDLKPGDRFRFHGDSRTIATKLAGNTWRLNKGAPVKDAPPLCFIEKITEEN